MSQAKHPLERYNLEQEINVIEYLYRRLRSTRGTDRHRPGDRRREMTYRKQLRRLKKWLRKLPPERSVYGNLMTRSFIGNLENCYAYARSLEMEQVPLPSPEDGRLVALFCNKRTLQLLSYCEGDLVQYQCLSTSTLEWEISRIHTYYLEHG